MNGGIVEKGLRELREGNPAIYWAVMARDGVTISYELPENVHHETFSIMCATLLGAAHTLNSEFPDSDVERIIIEAGKFRLLIIGVDLDVLIAVILPRNLDLSSLLVYLQRIIKQVHHK